MTQNFLKAKVQISFQNYNEATAKQIARSFRDLLRKNNYTCKITLKVDCIIVKINAKPNLHSREEFVKLMKNFALKQPVKINFYIEAFLSAVVLLNIWNNDTIKYELNYHERIFAY